MISINNLSIHFTGDYLFDDISFVIADKDRIGLVGKNGAGKTTLMRIIAQMQESESGNIVISTDTTIGYLPQEITFVNTGKTVIEEALTAFSEVLKVEEILKKSGINERVIFYGIEDIVTSNPIWSVFSFIKKVTPSYVQLYKLPVEKLHGVVTRIEM